jgi:hypothetical protein
MIAFDTVIDLLQFPDDWTVEESMFSLTTLTHKSGIVASWDGFLRADGYVSVPHRGKLMATKCGWLQGRRLRKEMDRVVEHHRLASVRLKFEPKPQPKPQPKRKGKR